MTRLLRAATLIACLLAGWLVYLPALCGELVWDDTYLVGENPFFKSPTFGFEVFRHWLFFDSFSTYYRPVQNWSYMLDYWLWRGAPMGYHATNILLHSLSGFLLYLLLRLQGVLPFNPQALGPVSPDSAFNTAISFVTNTNWQGHGGETTCHW